MKKIMAFMGVYLPGEKFGGPVTSIKNFSDCFGDEYDIRVVCSNHDFLETEPYPDIEEGWNTQGKAKVMYLKDEEIGYKTFYNILEKERPDLIYASQIMAIKFNYGFIKAAKELKIPILLAPRGDICSNAIKLKKWKKLPFLFVARIMGLYKDMYFQATIEEERINLKKYLGVDSKDVFLLPNIPAMPKEKLHSKEEGKIRIIFLSRIQRKKNLLDAINAVNKLECDAVFHIYGPKEEETYFDLCMKEAANAPNNVIIEYKGALSPTDAGRVFCEYDCFLFPTTTENYGHVIAESLLCECPIIISKGTTPWDDAEGKAGFVVELGDIEGFKDALDKIAKMDGNQYGELLNLLNDYRKVHMNVDNIKEKYRKMFEEIVR